MVEAGVWLTVTGIVVFALLTVATIRLMASVLAEGEHGADEHGAEPVAGEAEQEDETPAADGGQTADA